MWEHLQFLQRSQQWLLATYLIPGRGRRGLKLWSGNLGSNNNPPKWECLERTPVLPKMLAMFWLVDTNIRPFWQSFQSFAHCPEKINGTNYGCLVYFPCWSNRQTLLLSTLGGEVGLAWQAYLTSFWRRNPYEFPDNQDFIDFGILHHSGEKCKFLVCYVVPCIYWCGWALSPGAFQRIFGHWNADTGMTTSPLYDPHVFLLSKIPMPWSVSTKNASPKKMHITNNEACNIVETTFPVDNASKRLGPYPWKRFAWNVGLLIIMDGMSNNLAPFMTKFL